MLDLGLQACGESTVAVCHSCPLAFSSMRHCLRTEAQTWASPLLFFADPSLEQRLTLPGSLLSRLHASCAPALAPYSSREAACDALCALADQLSGSSAAEDSHLAQQLVDGGAISMLLTAAHSEVFGGQPVPDLEGSFMYDAGRLAQLVGPLYMERLNSCQALSLTMRSAHAPWRSDPASAVCRNANHNAAAAPFQSGLHADV